MTPLSRRAFIAGTTTAAGAMALPRQAFGADRCDVIIIGAGLAGLNAASILHQQGLRVVVVEAAAQAGGRVRSHHGPDGPIDVGASQIGRSYARVIDACHRVGLTLVPEDRDLLTFGMHYRGTWIDPATWASHPFNHTIGDERAISPLAMGSTLANRYNPLKDLDDWLDPRFADRDVSLRQLLQAKGHSAQAIELAALSAPGISIDDTSVLRMWQEATRSQFDRRFDKVPGGLAAISNIAGGCAQLPLRMAAALGDAVRLNKRVARIAMIDSVGTVTCDDASQYSAPHIISAIPFTMLRQVTIEARDYAGPSQQAIMTMPYANTARIYLSIDRPFWHDDGLPPSFSTDGPLGMFWAIDNHQATGPHRAMVVLTGVAAQGTERLAPDQLEAMMVAQLAQLRPASQGLVHVLTSKDWARDPLQRGCGFSLAPGQVNAFARAMLTPWQVMHFAGEHTRRSDFGMESAMESGERAALEILARS